MRHGENKQNVGQHSTVLLTPAILKPCCEGPKHCLMLVPALIFMTQVMECRIFNRKLEVESGGIIRQSLPYTTI